MKKVAIDDLVRRIDRPFVPLDIATVDGVRVKLVLVEGAYPSHVHPGRTELFLVYRGNIGVQVGDDVVSLSEGEALAVPGGTKHRSFADQPAWVIVVESAAITQREEPT